LVTVEARFFAFQRVNPSGRGWHEDAQAEMTSVTKTNRPRDRYAKFDFKSIPQALPTASRTEKPFTAKLNPPDRSSLQLAPWYLAHGYRFRKTTSSQLITQLLAGCLPSPAASFLVTRQHKWYAGSPPPRLTQERRVAPGITSAHSQQDQLQVRFPADLTEPTEGIQSFQLSLFES
jgi:hypothetical protein